MKFIGALLPYFMEHVLLSIFAHWGHFMRVQMAPKSTAICSQKQVPHLVLQRNSSYSSPRERPREFVNLVPLITKLQSWGQGRKVLFHCYRKSEKRVTGHSHKWAAAKQQQHRKTREKQGEKGCSISVGVD